MLFTESDLPAVLLRLTLKPVDSPSASIGISQETLKAGETAISAEGDVFFDAINVREALEIYSVVRSLRPDHSAEIGFCCAGSGLAILKALEDERHGVHHACDPYQSTYAKNAGRRNVDEAGLAHRLDFRESFPEDVFPGLPPLQFAFIDASHLFDISMLDFVLADKKLEVGGVVAFHDLWMPSLQKLVRYILTNRSYEIYRPAGASRERSRGLRATAAAGLSTVLRHIPRAEKLFRPELLEPWSAFDFGNMAFLRKKAIDTRDWRHHRPF